MVIVQVDTFNTYSSNYEDSAEAIALKEIFLLSSEQIVTDYLGFRPLLQSYTDEVLSGGGMKRLYVPARKIVSVESLSIDHLPVSPSLLVLQDDHVRFKDNKRLFPHGEDNILISFTAGWSVEAMPDVITLSILRIATLMLSETGGNIGLTGKSFADNSRTFINYSNYRKYLQPLDALRITAF